MAPHFTKVPATTGASWYRSSLQQLSLFAHRCAPPVAHKESIEYSVEEDPGKWGVIFRPINMDWMVDISIGQVTDNGQPLYFFIVHGQHILTAPCIDTIVNILVIISSLT